MKVLLIAYEFPPLTAAQSLRWFYLANGLAAAGVRVHVVCPAITAAVPFAVGLHAGVTAHRVWPGPFVGVSQSMALRANSGVQMHSANDAAAEHSLLFSGYQFVRSMLNTVVYPDVRTEWYPFARAKVRELLARGGFDAVISSHEPAVDLFLGLFAQRRYGLPWVVDMGDPLLTPYSPWWRKKLDLYVERHVLTRADAIWITTPNVAELLHERHGAGIRQRVRVIPQGFSAGVPRVLDPSRGAARVMHLLFTGTFYKKFRSPVQLALALRELADLPISFTIVGDNDSFISYFEGLKNVRFLGKRDHFACLTMQQESDLLVNLGNVQDFQVPGKLYEYLGCGVPIFHIQTGSVDSSAALIVETGGGTVVQNRSDEIAKALRLIYAQWINDSNYAYRSRRDDLIAEHAWSKRVGLCLQSLYAVCSPKD